MNLIIQFISELLIIILERNVCGFNQEIIDSFYAEYDDPFDDDVIYAFDEEAFQSTVDTTKQYLITCEEKGGIITKYAKDFRHFYSLWAVIALNTNRLLPEDEFIEKYSSFMDQVERFKDPSFIESYSSDTADPNLHKSYKYYMASVGANTEEPQRVARHAILLNIVFGDEIQNEDSTID